MQAITKRIITLRQVRVMVRMRVLFRKSFTGLHSWVLWMVTASLDFTSAGLERRLTKS
jgi:hypothetical protein